MKLFFCFKGPASLQQYFIKQNLMNCKSSFHILEVVFHFPPVSEEYFKYKVAYSCAVACSACVAAIKNTRLHKEPSEFHPNREPHSQVAKGWTLPLFSISKLASITARSHGVWWPRLVHSNLHPLPAPFTRSKSCPVTLKKGLHSSNEPRHNVYKV